MFKSTIKKSNIINSLLYTQSNNKALLNKINFENNQSNQKTFLIDDTKKRLIPKLKEEKRLYNTKSEINFNQKHINNLINTKKPLKNPNNDFHSLKKENCLQKLKDMIFSPGDVNYNGKEFKENGGTYNNYNNYSIRPSQNLLKQTLTNLLPKKADNKKTLVLDLDETLIHSAFEAFKPKDDITLTMKMKDEEIIIHVKKRPYLDEFLNIVTQKYEVIIFTASISDYANPLLDQLDPNKKISFRLFREHCTKSDNGLFIKDLNKLGRNLKDVIIIDNNPVSFIYNKANGLPILTWHSIQTDNELIKLIPLLNYLVEVDDIRPVINKVVNGYYVNYKEVNKIINNNNSNRDDDYFNNWYPNTTVKKMEKNNSYKIDYKDEKKKNKENINNSNINNNNINQDYAIKRKESFEHLIKYKGLLGSKQEINFDNYKNSRHTKLFSGFVNNINNNSKNNNNGYLTKKSTFIDFFEEDKKNNDKENKRDNFNSIFGLNIKRNHSSKNLIKINKFVNNENEVDNYFKTKKIKKEKNQIKYKDISFNKYNKEFLNNSKLNKTDANININNINSNNNANNKNNSDYANIIMNNNTNIINNNIYVINNKQTIDNNNDNDNTIEYSNRNIFNEDIINKSMNGYKSANHFYDKNERSQSAQYRQRQINQNKDLTKLIDNLINYNKTNNKNININPNQLIAISNNSKNINNNKLINDKINNLHLNNTRIGKDLLNLYNMRSNNEKINKDNKNLLLNGFNSRLSIYNINNMNFYNSHKNNKNSFYVDTGNNIGNYSNKNIKKSFLYDDNERIKKNINEYNNFKLIKHYTNIGPNKTIKYMSPISNFKSNLYN